MTTRKFRVTVTASVTLELDERVLAHVDDDWRRQFYPLRSAEEVAEHLGHNVLLNGCDLSDIDGFANLDDALMRVSDEDVEDIEVEALPA